MNDIMVDLETLGTVPGCVILSIGAVAFDRETGALGEEFYTVISRKSCEEAGLRVSADTLCWWARQSDEARAVLTLAEQGGFVSLEDALQAFSGYCISQGKDVRVWGNGADFDNAILNYAYAATNVAKGWDYHTSRCYRTLQDLVGPVEGFVRVGTFHNALDDARSQALYACKLFQALHTFNRCN